ncbi:Fe(3+) ions import ATP-binding protein FbpC 1 [uncultured Pleomorphomonas sp.]|uniref:Fe(3+) ions import ATP-binding protein FbpC 1 n=1 Tax=uncultured Pleomorphomonas sp. TaxID=442121 RepID=A0A212LP63_9HYPH|nr:ABC transporter ATP-binding protein [uncultured Pleomorphomonas sp.]SCM79338.1 Fe(3+) ions import ATP-binding protein FbpC 1 [uncultured Pleomorphomonas sp.]
MAQVRLSGIAKTFGKVTALDAMDLVIDDGELVCLLGPSGSGKSTLLRIIGGFETPSAGAIAIDGVDVTGLPPERRPTAMVFQSHALWSHMTVHGNIAFGLKLRRLPKSEIRDRVERVLDLVGLSGCGGRLPSQLSGGQQQRVALARSLVIEPKILLLDEPFASLDQHLRERLRDEVRDIQQRLGITAVFVTHGQDEALAISDRIVVLADGRMQQVGRPGEIYAEPKTAFVAGFIGAMNMLDGLLADGEIAASGLRLAAEGSGPARLAIRPEDIALSEPADGRAATVRRMIDFGAHVVIDSALADGTHLRIQTDKAIRVAPGERIGIRVDRWTVFTEDGEPRRYRSDTLRSFRDVRYA